MLSAMQWPKPIPWKRIIVAATFGMVCFLVTDWAMRIDRSSLLVVLPLLAVVASILDSRMVREWLNRRAE